MSNHFHLVVETPQPNLVFGMKRLPGAYTKRYNIRYRRCGHLFAGRYKALVVKGSGNGTERQETSMGLKWIAEPLQMGTWTYGFNLLNQRAEASHLRKCCLSRRSRRAALHET